MLAHAVVFVAHALVLAATAPNAGADVLSRPVLDSVAGPLLTSAQFLIPSAVAISGIHKMMDHRESGGSFLELPDLPPAVVAYIAPRARRHREHPLTQRYVDAIALRARAIIELPDEADNVRYAGMAGVPLDSVSRRLRTGYRALTQAVVLAAGVTR